MGNCCFADNHDHVALGDAAGSTRPALTKSKSKVQLDDIHPTVPAAEEEDAAPKPLLLQRGLDGVLSPKHFRKITLLGKGAVGRVYLVQYKETGSYYAMKVLTKKEMIEKNKVKRVLTEHEVLASTDHPMIVTLYASFQARDYLFFVMEYCPGGEFFRMLKRQPGKCLPEDHARFYAAEVVLALEYLHSCGFMYRDLKPENILLSAEGHIRLTDFDLSQVTNCPEQLQEMYIPPDELRPKCTSFVGTLEYVAPEMIMGTPHDSSVDWWTFGILLYEMLFGTTPFIGKTMAEAFRSIVACNLQFPKTTVVSKHCRDLISALLVKGKRLGSEHGAADIKKHPFFKGIDWEHLHLQKPPIQPRLMSPTDTHNFAAPRDPDDLNWDGLESSRDATFGIFGYAKRGFGRAASEDDLHEMMKRKLREAEGETAEETFMRNQMTV